MSQQSEAIERQSSKDAEHDSGAKGINALLTMIGLGVLSVILFFLLYQYGNDIRHLAEITNAGDKQYFYVPIIIAIVFSFVHGAFTGHFWDVLGLKPKK